METATTKTTPIITTTTASLIDSMGDANVLSESLLAEARDFEGHKFPLTLSPKTGYQATIEELINRLSTNRTTIDDLLRKHKSILFRGYGLNNHEDFDRVIKAIDYQTMVNKN